MDRNRRLNHAQVEVKVRSVRTPDLAGRVSPVLYPVWCGCGCGVGPHDPSKTSAVPYEVHMRRVEEVGVDLLAALFRDEHGLAFDVLNADSCVSQIRGRPKMVCVEVRRKWSGERMFLVALHAWW